MSKLSTFKFSLATLTIAALTACGGGGSSEPTQTTTPGTGTTPPVTTTPVGPLTLKMTGLSMKRGETLAKTASNTTIVGSILNYFKRGATNAFSLGNTAYAAAGGLPQTSVSDGTTSFTNKVIDGVLLSLQPQLVATDGSTIKCDMTKVDVKVNTLWNADVVNGHMLTNLTIPATISSDCALTYRTADFLITGSGKAIELTSDIAGFNNIIQAGDEGFNTTDTPLLTYATGQIKAMKIDEAAGKVTVSDLNYGTLPLATTWGTNGPARVGSIAYDGKYLIGVPQQDSSTLLMFDLTGPQIKTTKIKARPDDNRVSSYPGNGIILTSAGDFVWTATYGKLDLANATYTAASVEFRAECVDPSDPYSLTRGMGSGNYKDDGFSTYCMTPATEPYRALFGYGLVGRSGDTYLTDRGNLVNVKTHTAYDLKAYPNITVSPTYIDIAKLQGNVSYTRLVNGYAYVVKGDNTVMTRYDVKNDKVSGFDLDSLGLFIQKQCTIGGVVGQCYTMYDDHVLVDVTALSNGDRKFVELNFNTGVMTDRGIIQSGDRKVVDLVIPQN